MCSTDAPGGKWRCEVEGGQARLFSLPTVDEAYQTAMKGDGASWKWRLRATIPLDEAVKIAATLMAHRKRAHVDEDAVLAMEGG
jgi:hypothetical protein